MLIAFIISLCLNFAFGVAMAFLVWLLRQQARVVRTLPAAAVKDAPVDVQAAVSMAEAVSGLTAEEEADRKREDEWAAYEAAQALREDFGIDPSELARITSL